MYGEKPVNVIRRFNANLDKATRSLDEISRLIKELENALHELEKQKGDIKKDALAKTELSTCGMKIMSLKGAISRLQLELSDTQSKIDRVKL